MSDLVVVVIIALLIGWSLEEFGIGLIFLICLGIFLGPQVIENTDNACQAVSVISYRHQHTSDSNAPIPTDVWNRLMADGKQVASQTGEIHCVDSYWRIAVGKQPIN